MLLVLLSGQRCQTIHCLDTRNMFLTPDKVRFTMGDLLKTSRPTHHMSMISFSAFPCDRRLCVIHHLRIYLHKTLDNRGLVTRLLLTTTRPYRAASQDTIRRWVKDILQAAGIDLAIFSSHSTRSATTSRAAQTLPLQTIIRTAGWSNDCIFRKYYKKPVAEDGLFSDAILSAHKQ